MRTISDRSNDEMIAKLQIDVRLAPLVKLADELDSLFERALDSVSGHPRSGPETVAATKVCLILTGRLANDIRVCSIASRFGYGLQAMGLAATVQEVVGALCYVGDDEARAHEWATHANQRKTFPPTVKDGINAAAAALDMPEAARGPWQDQWQRVYTALCMAKHANPMVTMDQGLRVFADDAYFVRGPDASELGAKYSCFALFHAVWFGSVGLHAFVKCCSDQGLQVQLRNEALKVNVQLRDVEPLLHGLMAVPTAEPGWSEAERLQLETERLQQETEHFRSETERLQRETEHMRRETQRLRLESEKHG